MLVRTAICIWIFALLLSCGGRKDSDDTETSTHPEPRVTRADRSRDATAPSQHQQFRASLAAAIKVESSEARDKALVGLAWETLESDPDLFAKALEHISADNADRIPLIQSYAMQLAGQNPDDALAWAASLNTDKEIAAAKDQIVLVLADIDPQRAARLIPIPGAGNNEIDGNALHVLQRWIAEKPLDAARWVVTFPSGDSRKVAIKTLVSDWAQTDSKGAFAWLAGLNNESIRAEGTQAMLEALIQQPQSIREEWLEQADPIIRSELELRLDQTHRDTEETIPEPPGDNDVTEPQSSGEP